MKQAKRSPRVIIEITPDHWNTAKVADSAACLISDAAKEQHPDLTRWETDVVTIRATDKAAGVRYTWITPEAARDLLLAFDQGWAQPDQHRVVLNGAAKITKLYRPPATTARRAERLAELEAKEQAGTITGRERQQLAHSRNVSPRATSPGRVVDVVQDGDAHTVIGGRSVGGTRTRNPNLLAGRVRTFGARTAQPSTVFRAAVDAEVAARLAELAAGPTSEAVGSDDAGPAAAAR